MENIRKPQILIQTDGITNTKIFIDGKELPGVAGVRFSQSYKENKGLPVLQIELKATNVTLDENYVDEHALTTTISRIRSKIETNRHSYIKTVYGMGYMWIGGVQK